MSNYKLKAKNKQTGEIIIGFMDNNNSIFSSPMNVHNNGFSISKQKFNELYEVIPQTDLGVNDDTSKKDDILDEQHPYGGMEVLDNVPKETWEDRLDIFLSKRRSTEDLKNFFQQELERIKNNFMTNFTDPDTGMLDIGKYDHEEIINFFNKEIK